MCAHISTAHVKIREQCIGISNLCEIWEPNSGSHFGRTALWVCKDVVLCLAVVTLPAEPLSLFHLVLLLEAGSHSVAQAGLELVQHMTPERCNQPSAPSYFWQNVHHSLLLGDFSGLVSFHSLDVRSCEEPVDFDPFGGVE